jgi:glycosyltransferase involved in cell wall biosynthesis
MIVLNAASVLKKAIESLPPGTDLVVADGDSTDQTAILAERLGARVVSQNLDDVARAGGNFDVARNQAGQYARHPWILFLDADERLTDALVLEIGQAIQQDGYAAFALPRKNLFWGRPVRLLGQDYQIRLVRQGRGFFSGEKLHQPMQVQGDIGYLQSPLIHENMTHLKEIYRKFKQYVPIEVKAFSGRPSRGEMFRHPLRMFRYYYLRQQAWRDGPIGLFVCLVYAFYHGWILWGARRLHDF